MQNNEKALWVGALLDIARKPVGVKFLLSGEDYKAFPAQELKSRMSYCTTVRRAGEGIGCKFHFGHMACSGGAVALGLEKQTEQMISGERRYKQGAYQDLCMCRKVSKHMTYCQHSAYGVAVMPLDEFLVDPDVVVIVCEPFQAMRLVQAYAYSNGHAENICLSGMQAICQECTSLPFENDQLNLSLMCAGTRMLAGWKNSEMALGMPYRIFVELVEGLKATVNPLERDAGKRAIAQRLSERGLEDPSFTIVYGRNYDDGCYKGGPVGSPKEL